MKMLVSLRIYLVFGVAGGLLLALGLLLGTGMLTVANDGVNISVVAADGKFKGNDWIGLWESVDPDDGGLNVIRINEDGNGGFAGVQHSNFSTVCTLQGHDGSRELILSTATLDPDNKKILNVTSELICFGPDGITQISAGVIEHDAELLDLWPAFQSGRSARLGPFPRNPGPLVSHQNTNLMLEQDAG